MAIRDDDLYHVDRDTMKYMNDINLLIVIGDISIFQFGLWK